MLAGAILLEDMKNVALEALITQLLRFAFLLLFGLGIFGLKRPLIIWRPCIASFEGITTIKGC